MELRKCFGKSGVVYYVFHSPPNEKWRVFKETATGFVHLTSINPAIDCGAIGERDPDGNRIMGDEGTHTRDYWSQIWKD